MRKHLAQHFREYGAFHTDRRNELTHAVGIPLILIAVIAWARLVTVQIGPVAVDLGQVLIFLVFAVYLTMSARVALALSVVLIGFYAVTSLPVAGTPLCGLVAFVVGWILQFVGHAFEGKRPAFFQNAVHLLIGPAWILDRSLSVLGVELLGNVDTKTTPEIR